MVISWGARSTFTPDAEKPVNLAVDGFLLGDPKGI